MRVAEMRRREDFDRILAATLASGWSLQFGWDVRVSSEPGGAERWILQPLLSAFVVRHAGREVRKFLCEFFRSTPVRVRAPAQWLLGTFLATPLGLSCTARAGFWTSPGVPDAAYRAVVPGNQRVRVFDFSSGTSRVMLKRGFDRGPFANEIAIRATGAGPFPAITAHGEDWFEERIVDGWALPRCPRRVDRREASARALDTLEAWLERSVRSTSAAEHAARLVGDIEAALPRVPGGAAPWAGLVAGVSRLAARAATLGEIELARGHGDFQPGNVLIARNGKDVWIIDWEHAAERYRPYDQLVWTLATRSGAGIAGRIQAFVDGDTAPALSRGPRALANRAGVAAMFVLEDVLWFARESAAGPYRDASTGLQEYRAALPAIESIVRERGSRA